MLSFFYVFIIFFVTNFYKINFKLFYIMRVNALSTGSCGNCFIINLNNDSKKFAMIDCGFSFKQLDKMLSDENISFSQISHLIITHEHIDHVKGLKQIIKKYPTINIIISKGTNQALSLNYENTTFIKSNEKISIDNIEITGIEKNHDGIEPLSYVIYDLFSKKKIGIFNDLGDYNIVHCNILKQCDIIFLECNYDDELVKSSQMHYSYLQRLQSPLGHLSNSQAANLCSTFISDNQTIILSHISENVNSYFIAYEKINSIVKSSKAKNVKVLTSFQLHPTGWIE